MSEPESQKIHDTRDQGDVLLWRPYNLYEEIHEEEEKDKWQLCDEYVYYGKWDVDDLVATGDLDEVYIMYDVDDLVGKWDVDDLVGKWDVDDLVGKWDVDDLVGKWDVDDLVGKLYEHGVISKMGMHAPWWKDLPRYNTTKASKVRDDGSTDGFCFLVERKELPKTDTKKPPKQLWLLYCQADSPGESKTLLSKPLYDERLETENFINNSSKQVDHCTSAKKDKAIIPDNDRLLCKVCYMKELSIVFLPCSHMVACRRCAARLKTCPVCRSGIKEALPANLHE